LEEVASGKEKELAYKSWKGCWGKVEGLMMDTGVSTKE
jgi:hypothetical protein